MANHYLVIGLIEPNGQGQSCFIFFGTDGADSRSPSASLLSVYQGPGKVHSSGETTVRSNADLSTLKIYNLGDSL